MISLEPGLVVANWYRLDRLLGQGGMGVVWAATHVDTRERVALKFLKGEEHPDVRRRFLREARAACAVRHENVVQVHDVLELSDGAPVMVMDLLDGESLARLLERSGKLGVSQTARILLQVASGVGAAHALGIVHRDLKPDNVFLVPGEGPDVDVRVLDFGVAKLTAVDGETAQTAGLTVSGALLGTPCYMAPEQAFGESDVDHRADVWALGLILYQCLSGTLPTQADNVGQVLKIVLTKQIPPLASAAPEVPSRLTNLVDRMLSREREHRPGDLREVAQVLGTFTDARSSHAPIPPARQRTDGAPVDAPDGSHDSLAVTGPGVLEARTPDPGLLTRHPRASRTLAGVGIVAVVLAVGAVALRARGPGARGAQADVAPDQDGTSTSFATSAPPEAVPSGTAAPAPSSEPQPDPTGARSTVARQRPASSPSASSVATPAQSAREIPTPRASVSASPAPAAAASHGPKDLKGALVEKPPF